MDLLAKIQEAYSSSDDNQSESSDQKQDNQLQQVEIAPTVNILDLQLEKSQRELRKFETTNQLSTKNNHLNGVIEQIFVNEGKFYEQYHNFENFGHAINPTDNSGQQIVHSNTVKKVDLDANVENLASKNRKAYRKELKRKRQTQGDAASGDFMGPWALYEGMEQFKTQKAELSEEQKEMMQRYEEMRKERLEEVKQKEPKEIELHKATTVFHGIGGEQGKSFIDHPSYLRNKEHACFIPKKWLHTWVGHNKGVQKIEFFPKYGHLMLSASHDSTIKIWDVMTHRKCLRTYMGHNKAVRDVAFTNDGRKFLSAGFDRVVQLWDTETGKVIRSFTNKKTPFCIKFHPQDDKQNIFLVGCANKKILQYDINSSEITQQYEEHLGAINTITFIEGGRRFVSTADDKKIFLWEFGIPVVAKHISEPDMQAIPAATMHPNGKYFAGQSMDNKVVIYDCKGNFKMNRKKKFVGHLNSGYACGLDFSPDGQFLGSGDADGKLWFWNWKTCKNLRSMKVHEGVCIDVKWHPIEPSKVATCGWDVEKQKRKRQKKFMKTQERTKQMQEEEKKLKFKMHHSNEDAVSRLQREFPNYDIDTIELVYSSCDGDYNQAVYNLDQMQGDQRTTEKIDQGFALDSDGSMDEYDKEVIEEFKKDGIQPANKIFGSGMGRVSNDFDQMMEMIDKDGYFEEPSFLKISSRDYDWIKSHKPKEQIKPQPQRGQYQKEEEKYDNKKASPTKMGQTPKSENLNEVINELLDIFKNFDREVIEDVVYQIQNREEVFDYLMELEAHLVDQQDEDLESQFEEEQDYDKLEDDLEMLNFIEQDRHLAERLNADEIRNQQEQFYNEQLEFINNLGLSEDQFTNLKIQEKLREFLYNYRFEQRVQKIQQANRYSEKDLQMKKAKKLKASEQDVFREFLEKLQIECFDMLLAKKNIYVIQESLNQEEKIHNMQMQQQKQNPNYKREYDQAFQKSKIQLGNKSQFPDLVDEKVIKKTQEKRIREQRMEIHNEKNFLSKRRFRASTSEQLEQLGRIHDQFSGLDADLIQDTYDLLNDADLTLSLLLIAFPGLHRKLESTKFDEIMSNLNKYENFARNDKTKVKKGGSRSNTFFTEEILRKFRNFNHQRQKPQQVQAVFDTARDKGKKIYAMRQQFLKEIQRAKKSGNYQQLMFAQAQAEKYKDDYDKFQHIAQQEIFQLKNQFDLKDQYIDLHGLYLQEALKILRDRMRDIQIDLNNGVLQPNIDGRNHVLKIVCGRGIHSKGRPVLKTRIPEFLKQQNYDYFNFANDGVVLVRFQRK